MKKLRFILGALIIAVVITVILVLTLNSKRMMLSFPKEELTSVLITNGNNGDMVELSAEEMDSLADLCTSIECKKIHMEEQGGWAYSIDFTSENKSSKVSILSPDLCRINGSFYNLPSEKGQAVIDIIEKLYSHKERIKSGG